MHSSEAAKLKQIEEFASVHFKDHLLEVNLAQGAYREWHCHRPGTWAYSFRVSTGPGRLLVTGDIGHLLLVREPDMIPWVRRAIGDLHYLASKVVGVPTTKWDEDVVRDWLAEQERGLRQDLAQGQSSGARLARISHARDALPDLHAALSDGRPFFEIALHESQLVSGMDWPRLEGWTPNFLWCREALRWFLTHLPEV